MSALLQKIRSIGVSCTIRALNWNSDLLLLPGIYTMEITWRDRLGWLIEDQLSDLFGFFYTGSDEEIEAVYDCEIPRYAMSSRQRQAGFEAAIRGRLFDEVICIGCETAPLLVTDISNYCAGCRALHPEMLLEDAK